MNGKTPSPVIWIQLSPDASDKRFKFPTDTLSTHSKEADKGTESNKRL